MVLFPHMIVPICYFLPSSRNGTVFGACVSCHIVFYSVVKHWIWACKYLIYICLMSYTGH